MLREQNYHSSVPQTLSFFATYFFGALLQPNHSQSRNEMRLGAYLLEGQPAQILQLRKINVFALDTFMYIHTHAHIYICTYVCIYIYIYIHAYVYLLTFSAVLYYYFILPVQSLLLHFVCSDYSLKDDVVILSVWQMALIIRWPRYFHTYIRWKLPARCKTDYSCLLKRNRWRSVNLHWTVTSSGFP